MSETKWTPGPYERAGTTVYALNEQGSNRFSAFVDAGFERKSAGPGGRKCTAHEECEATAQLFTAAPELYEALAHLCYLQSGNPATGVQAEQWLRDAYAALAKARGETNE